MESDDPHSEGSRFSTNFCDDYIKCIKQIGNTDIH